ncbi:MAG: amino-acid N-acetyltransferase [Spirochaetales bacterium]|nr:amino-acid N-acetyltransferase [Spirochaetales bacterium]
MQSLQHQVETIRTAFSYINRFKERIFVIQIDSALIDTPIFPLLIKDIVLLHNMGIKILLVPGARVRIDEILSQYNITFTTVNNMRITNPEAMPFIKMASFDVSTKVMTLLAENNAHAVIGNWVKARSIGVIDGVDYMDSGLVEKLKIDIIQNTIKERLIPIFPNIGWSATGRPYNISSHELAFTISKELKAAKLFFITYSGGIHAGEFKIPGGVYVEDNIISQLKLPQAREFLEANKNVSKEIDYELVLLAHKACLAGVERVHIIDGKIEGMLLKEIFSNRGLGTMIYSDPHENIRPLKHADIPTILQIMQPLIDDKILVPRTYTDIEAHAPDYAVYEVDGTIHGCCAMHHYAGNQAEIAGIAVDHVYTNLGIGKKLVRYFMDKAESLGLRQVFVLTTQGIDWFSNLGFSRADPSILPVEKQKTYKPDRNSHVLVYVFKKR